MSTPPEVSAGISDMADDEICTVREDDGERRAHPLKCGVRRRFLKQRCIHPAKAVLHAPHDCISLFASPPYLPVRRSQSQVQECKDRVTTRDFTGDFTVPAAI